MKKRTSHLSSLVLSIFVMILISAEPARTQERDACVRKTIEVSVTDRLGAPVVGLKPADFRAEYKGRPVKIMGVKPDERPRDIVILVDASGSVHKTQDSPGTWKLNLAMASDLARNRVKNTRFALLIFGTTVLEELDFSDDEAAVLRKLQGILADKDFEKSRLGGATALLDTSAAATRLFQHPNSANLIYVITDGGDNHSKISIEKLEQILSDQGVRFYSSVVSSLKKPYRSREEINGLETMRQISSASGGIAFGPLVNTDNGFFLPDAALLKVSEDQLLMNFYQSMFKGYLLEIEFSDAVKKRGNLKLELVKERRTEIKDSHVSYSQIVEPCGNSSSN